jgi:hypothetical protein
MTFYIMTFGRKTQIRMTFGRKAQIRMTLAERHKLE